jgi:hypothetical protein
MQIEPSRWAEYLAELSRQADGYDTAIEILSPELGDQVEVTSAPLIEISFEPREGIAVAIGDRAGHVEVLRHTIARPRLLEATDEPGVPGALLIEDDDGTRTLVRLAARGPEPGS